MPRMLWPLFGLRSAKSLSFARGSFTLRAAFFILLQLMSSMNAVSDFSRAAAHSTGPATLPPPPHSFLENDAMPKIHSSPDLLLSVVGTAGRLSKEIMIWRPAEHEMPRFLFQSDRITVVSTMHKCPTMWVLPWGYC